MADSIFQPMRFTIDLDSALVMQTGCGQLIYGDKLANVIEVKVHRSGKTIDLTGMTATGAFYRPVDGAEVPLPGVISANVVSVQLIDECYETEGHYEAEVKLSQGEVRRTILSIVGYVHRAGSGAVVNVTGVVPSIPELLAQISAMEAAAERANTAAARAEALAIDANGYAQNAKQLDGKSADQYALKTDTAPNSAKLGGKAPEYYLQPVNLLDNSDFRNPVNQRGQTSYTEGRHTIDRWEMWVESGIANVSLMEGYISISFGGHGTFHQKLAKGVLDLSKQYSLAIKKHGGLMMVGPAYIASNSEHDSVAVADLRDGDTMEIEWCAIYEGSYTAETLPPYVPKGYAAELAACQRYAFPLPEFVGIPGYITSEGKQFIFAVSCPPMRDAGSTKPTVSEIPQFTIRTVSGYSSIATQEAPGTPNSLVVQDYSPDSHQMTLCATFASAIGTNNTPACGQIRYGVRPLISLDL